MSSSLIVWVYIRVLVSGVWAGAYIHEIGKGRFVFVYIVFWICAGELRYDTRLRAFVYIKVGECNY